jgi:NADH:ubiquinone oxidoreductase subunit D
VARDARHGSRRRVGHVVLLPGASPSLLACQALEQMIVGGLIADVIAVIGSIDVVMGDVDR